MSVGSAKAKLDAQGGDPPTGYISKQDVKDSYDELVADTALSGATTVAGTINGRDPDDLVKGPASATDNALVRFDGTGGKTVQGSGITVDDSNNITSNLTMSKASPALTLLASSGNAYANIKANAGSDLAGIGLWANAYRRWIIAKNTTAESGADVGSDLIIQAYDDTGGALTTPVTITRSTGKVRLGSVGATAGLELGTSGPRIMSGTGSPEGVVTAPVGSQWIDTAATTGAVAWRKASGTGSTGWKVEYGDTGSRNIAALAGSIGTLTLFTWALRRIGQVVTMWLVWADSQTTPSRVTLGTLPSGFRPEARFYMGVPYDTAVTSLYRNVYVDSGGNVQYGGPTTASAFSMQATWTTANAWPAVLPGS